MKNDEEKVSSKLFVLISMMFVEWILDDNYITTRKEKAMVTVRKVLDMKLRDHDERQRKYNEKRKKKS